MSGLIKSWSFSRLSEFEQCAYRTKLKVVDRIPEPERPLKPGQTEHANDRGTRIHDAIEQYCRGNGPFPVEALKFKAEIDSLANHFVKGKASFEGEWGFDENWQEVDYKKAWCKVKCDAVIWLSKTEIVVIDYKTGRKHGNEIKHGEQLQLYALACACRFPDVETIHVELWYLDQDDMTTDVKHADKWLKAIKLFTNRGNKMLNETVFKPNPNAFSCNFCPYKDGICEHAYSDKKAVGNMYKRKAVRRKGEQL